MDRIDDIMQRAHAAAPFVAALPAERRAAVLNGLADCMEAAAPIVLGINARDAAAATGTRQRQLRLTGLALVRAREYLRRLAANVSDDPHSPGVAVIAIRPRARQALDCFAACLLDGKACVLVGPPGLAETNCGIGKFITAVLKGCGCPADACAVVYNASDDERRKLNGLLTKSEKP